MFEQQSTRISMRPWLFSSLALALSACQLISGIGNVELVDDPAAGGGGEGNTGGDGGMGGQGGGGGPPTFTISGTVTGLDGELVLTNNAGDPETITADGAFTFDTASIDGAGYLVAVESAPGLQGCRVSNGSGAIDGANVDDVEVACSGVVFFAANDGVHGKELWKTDGSEANTVMVKDINAGAASAIMTPGLDWNTNFPHARLPDGRVVFTAADDDTGGLKPWVSDGTDAGTFMLAAIGAASPPRFSSFGDRVTFSAYIGAGPSLVITDGTTDGTSALLELDTLDGPGVEHDGQLYFIAGYMSTGSELSRSDGTTAGTMVVEDIYTGFDSGAVIPGLPVVAPVVFGNRLFFTARNDETDVELWSSDGISNTTRYADINSGTAGSNASQLTVLGAQLLFSADDNSGLGIELWATDGISSPTLVLDINVAGDSAPRSLTTIGNLTYFSADDGEGHEPWVSDGSPTGTVLLGHLNTAAGMGSLPRGFLAIDGATLFMASDGTKNVLYQTDGTPAGTSPVGASVSVYDMGVVLDGRALFLGIEAATGTELWITDGTGAGTTLVKDICPTTCSSIQ